MKPGVQGVVGEDAVAGCHLVGGLDGSHMRLGGSEIPVTPAVLLVPHFLIHLLQGIMPATRTTRLWESFCLNSYSSARQRILQQRGQQFPAKLQHDRFLSFIGLCRAKSLQEYTRS